MLARHHFSKQTGGRAMFFIIPLLTKPCPCPRKTPHPIYGQASTLLTSGTINPVLTGRQATRWATVALARC